MRSFEEIKAAVEAASRLTDAKALLELSEEAKQIGTRETEFYVHFCKGLHLFYTGRSADALADADRALTAAENLNDTYGIALSHNLLGLIDRAFGDQVGEASTNASFVSRVNVLPLTHRVYKSTLPSLLRHIQQESPL